MLEKNLGTIGGISINQDMLNSFADIFEQDWHDSEIKFTHTERKKVLSALSGLNVPIYEIEALERRAASRQQSLSFYIHSILKQELLSADGIGIDK